MTPLKTPGPLADGSAFHMYLEGHNKNWTADEFKIAERESGLSNANLQVGKALAVSFVRQYDNDTRFSIFKDEKGVFAEREFSVAIPGSPHSIIGKIDEFVEFEHEKLGKGLWIGDYKSANNKATLNKKRIEFTDSKQSNFYINAAKLMDYDVKGMVYRVITKHTPPQHFVIPITRNEYELKVTLFNIHQVAETIEMYKRTFGTDVPWPHTAQYPCNYRNASGELMCDFASICSRFSSELSEVDLEQFLPKVSHLEINR